MMVIIIVGLFISLNSYASESSPANSYIKQKDDPRAVIGDDPYELSKSAPLHSSINPLYIKEPLPESQLRKVKSESFAWDDPENETAFLKTKRKVGLLTKIKRSLSKPDQKLEGIKNSPFCN